MVGPRRLIADVGAGDGRLTRHLLEIGRAVVPTELSRAQANRLRAALSRPDVPVLEGYGFRPLRDRKFDVVIVSGLGGATLARILDDHGLRPSWPLLLQPMQNLGALSRALRGINRGVARARLVDSHGRLYPILDLPLDQEWNGGPAGILDHLGLFLQDNPLWPRWLEEAARRQLRQRSRLPEGELRRRVDGELDAIRRLQAEALRHGPESSKISREPPRRTLHYPKT